jgi:hypothetical protein
MIGLNENSIIELFPLKCNQIKNGLQYFWLLSYKNMTHKIIKTEAACQKTVKRTIAIFEAKASTPEADELALLLVLVKDYEDKHIHIPTVYCKPYRCYKTYDRGIRY